MEHFNKLVWRVNPYIPGASSARVFFKNGFGASVARGLSWHNPDGYEVGVLVGDEESSELCYSTPITEDVLGGLDARDVQAVLQEIEALPPL